MSSKGRRGESPDSQPGSQEKSSAPKADERRGNKRPRPIESLNPIDETGRRSRGTDDKDVRGRSSTTLQDQQLRIQGVLEGIGIEGTRTNPVNLDRSDNNDRAELLRRMMSSTSSQQYPAFQSMTGGSTAQISPYSLPTRGTTPLDLSSPRQGPSDSPLTGLSHEQLINRLLQQGRYSESTASNPMGFGGYNLEAQQNALRNTLLGGQFAVSSSQQRGIGNDSSLASRLAEVQQQQELQRLLHARLRGAVMNSLSTSLGGPYQRDNAGLQEHLLESLSTSSVSSYRTYISLEISVSLGVCMTTNDILCCYYPYRYRQYPRSRTSRGLICWPRCISLPHRSVSYKTLQKVGFQVVLIDTWIATLTPMTSLKNFFSFNQELTMASFVHRKVTHTDQLYLLSILDCHPSSTISVVNLHESKIDCQQLHRSRIPMFFFQNFKGCDNNLVVIHPMKLPPQDY